MNIYNTYMFNLTPKAEAHVRYLVNEEESIKELSGRDDTFVFGPLGDGFNILLIAVTIVLILFAFFISKKISFIKTLIKNINNKLNSYAEYIPWILRLSLGIALVGGGVSNFLVSPVLTSAPELATLQILLGFLLLIGFFILPASIAVIAIYFFAFLQDFYILGNLDYLAIALSILILNNSRPGLDDILCLPKINLFKTIQQYVPLILRTGIGIAMMYLGLYEKILNPHLSEYVVINFGLLDVVPVSAAMWVFAAGFIEFTIGLFLLVGYKTRLVSAIAFIVLSLSFFYFGEGVTSHITLFGLLSVIFITGNKRLKTSQTKLTC